MKASILFILLLFSGVSVLATEKIQQPVRGLASMEFEENFADLTKLQVNQCQKYYDQRDKALCYICKAPTNVAISCFKK